MPDITIDEALSYLNFNEDNSVNLRTNNTVPKEFRHAQPANVRASFQIP